MTTSAALYFGLEQVQSVPLRWLERAREIFEIYDLSPVLFTADGGDFLLDDCYVLAEQGRNLVEWGDVVVARAGDLVDALRNGIVESLGLDSPRHGADDREDWRAMVLASATSGECYIGIDEDLVPDPAILLNRVYDMAKDLFDV